MKHLNLFLELTRIKRPIGYMLLFWPCAWGLTIGFDFSQETRIYYIYLSLFLLGAILMRSAGCIINDIADRNFDKKVLRTKNRPIASGKISVQLGLMYACLLCLLAFFVLINFNNFTIYIALASMPLAFTYPLMKRYTYWPQLFLGVTFNYGIILGWTAINNEINLVPLLLYFGAIFWTLGYDTIYGFQDIKDDEIIGLKSTSIKFKKSPYVFLYVCYLIFFLTLIMIGFFMKLNNMYFISLILIFLQLFYLQIKKLNIKSSKECLKIFKSNNYLGFFVFIALLVGKT
ncbi:4-hydroxybenzoate octaprenyltransferase [Pelagibacterales bacterium SAG-MED01]|nr:4-hydroxybenzoate octaprenyltransferase [Pelagibacterales bacterium SAG-MED01]|tara:strand:+ start:51 stop:914 length:864 start_codon:yes stop_codon:yes gene_type:complete